MFLGYLFCKCGSARYIWRTNLLPIFVCVESVLAENISISKVTLNNRQQWQNPHWITYSSNLTLFFITMWSISLLPRYVTKDPIIHCLHRSAAVMMGAYKSLWSVCKWSVTCVTQQLTFAYFKGAVCRIWSIQLDSIKLTKSVTFMMRWETSQYNTCGRLVLWIQKTQTLSYLMHF